MTKLIAVNDLSIAYAGPAGWTNVVEGVSFDIARGEAFGLVGESGSGKSTVAYRLLGYKAPNSLVQTGQVLFEGVDLLQLDAPALAALRGRRIAFVPQNPTTALSPGMRIGSQIREMISAHQALGSDASMDDRLRELFGLVGLPDVRRRYPHELSGGQQQRVTIAMAVACNPDLLVLDEPTTGLDVTTQRQIVGLLSELRRRIGMAMLYVTHDLALLAQIADRVGVMYAGRLVETADCETLLSRPLHPYSRGLIASIPTIQHASSGAKGLKGVLRRDQMPDGCKFQPRCDAAIEACRSTAPSLENVGAGHAVACMRWNELAPPAPPPRFDNGPADTSDATGNLLSLQNLTLSYARPGWLKALLGREEKITARDIEIELNAGEIVALVGESGSGKSTIARAISGRLAPLSGSIRLAGERLEPGLSRRSRKQLRQIQYIFQNPDASLNPRRKIRTILERPLVHFGIEFDTAVLENALESVGLHADYLERFPEQLSGGERQRVAIARALLVKPELLICDEILSALDVSVQAKIIELLASLKAQHAVAMLFISHDLAVVRQLADRVAVLYRGELMQVGRTDALFNSPWHPYTEMLLRAAPDLRKDDYRASPPSMPQSVAVQGRGCALAGRCPRQVDDRCAQSRPPLQRVADGFISCHIPSDQLTAASTQHVSQARFG